MTENALAGSGFGIVKIFCFNSLMRDLSFLAVAFAFSSAVRTLLARTFGLAFDFALLLVLAFAVVLALGFALGFALGLALGFAFGFAFAVEGVLLAAGLVVVVAFLRGLLGVRPVCAFGLDAGFVAKERRPMLMILRLKLHACPFGNVYPV